MRKNITEIIQVKSMIKQGNPKFNKKEISLLRANLDFKMIKIAFTVAKKKGQ